MAKKIRINPWDHLDRIESRNAGNYWTKEDDEKLLDLYLHEKVSISALSKIFQRSIWSIRSRIKLLLWAWNRPENTDLELQWDDEILLEKLKECRLEIAREKGWSPAYVMQDKVLYKIAKEKPHTKEEMLLIKWVWEQSFKNYWEQFLEIIKEYL